MTSDPVRPKTSFFKTGAADAPETKKSAKGRAKVRQQQYRLTLANRRAPELRHIADLLLASYLTTMGRLEDERLFHFNVLNRAMAAGFDLKEMTRCMKRARKKVLSVDAMNGFEPFLMVEDTKNMKFVNGYFVHDR